MEGDRMGSPFSPRVIARGLRLSSATGRLVAVLAACLLVAGFQATPALAGSGPNATPASQASVSHGGTAVSPLVSCHGSGCTGKDPSATGCSAGAQSISTFYGGADYNAAGGISETNVVLRWSNNCQANWAQNYTHDGIAADLWTAVGYNTSCNWVVGATGSCQIRWTNWTNSQSYWSHAYNDIYTDMLNGSSGTPCTGAVDDANADNMDNLTNCY
jgi:hypothetical protein